MFPAYVSNHNSNCKKKQVILLIIPNEAGWHYFALKKPSALDRGVKFQHHGGFYCLNRIHYFIKENKRESDA